VKLATFGAILKKSCAVLAWGEFLPHQRQNLHKRYVLLHNQLFSDNKLLDSFEPSQVR